MVDRVQIAVAALVRDGREPGELPERAVVRECREELGVQIHDPRPLALPVADSALDLHAFVVTRWDGEPVNAAPDEHDDLRWVLPEELVGLRLAHPDALESIVSAVTGRVSPRRT